MAGLFSVLVAAAASAASAQGFLYTFAGACDENRVMNGLSYINVGKTLSGAPFYKAIGYEYYIYFEPNCGDSKRRWVIDTRVPNQKVDSNLNGLPNCDYVAEVESSDITLVPTTAMWTMNCGGVNKAQYISILDRDTTTTVFPPGYYTGSATVGKAMPSLTLSGACQYHREFNGMIFDNFGKAADNSPLYKARGAEQYIYFDKDCDGNGPATGARWVIDESRPLPTVVSDLDNDRECNYHARMAASSGSGGPPSQAAWSMYCGTGWQTVSLTLKPGKSGDMMLTASARTVGSLLAPVLAMLFAQLTLLFAA